MKSKQIKAIRESLKLTQEQFAHEIGVTFVTVNRWELGRARPSPLAMQEIERLRKNVKIKN